MKKIFGGMGVWLLMLSFDANAATQEIVIQVPDKATVVGPEIHLGEIADVLGDNKAVLERIRRLTVGRAAPAGDTFNITQQSIKIALRREGYSLDQFVFGGEDTVKVLTQSQDFDPSSLLPELKKFVLRETGETPEDINVTLEGEGRSILMPAGNVSAKFRPSFSGKYEGSVFLTAELSVDDRLNRVLPLRVMVEVYHPAVTTVKNIEKGEKFSRQNTAVVKTPSSKIMNGCFRSLDYVLGRTAAMPLPSGTVLRVNNIYDPPVIHHGEVVQGVIDNGNIELTVQVRAIEDGKAGDSIRVENTESHKVLRGRVMDEKTIQIEQEALK